MEIITNRGVSAMNENNTKKKEYRKRHDFKINIIFNERGEKLEKIIERTFSNYCKNKI